MIDGFLSELFGQPTAQPPAPTPNPQPVAPQLMGQGGPTAPQPSDNMPALMGQVVPPPDNPAAPPDKVAKFVRALANHLSSLPARVAGASEDLRTGNDYDPAPAVEASSMLMGGGAGLAEKGAAGIFGGKLAAENLANAGIHQPRVALRMAEHMFGKGASDEDVYKVTNAMLKDTPYAGVSKGADGKLRFEIPDNEAKLTLDPGPMGMQAKRGPLADAISHPDAFGAYPHLRTLDASVTQSDKLATRGYFQSHEINGVPAPAHDSLNAVGPDPLSTVLHEMSHGVQRHEGFARGAAMNDMRSLALDLMHSRGQNMDSPTGVRNFEQAAREAYLAHAGEVEARNVQTRMNMTPAERRASPPWNTEDVPRDQQIVRALLGQLK